MNLLDKRVEWLSKWYPVDKLQQLSEDKLVLLYNNSQPKKVRMGSLEGVPTSSYRISSPDGYVTAHAWRNKGTKECVTLTTDSGNSITASTDHFFEMSDGKWKYAGCLFPGQCISTESGTETVTSVVAAGKHTVYDFYIDHENHRYYTNGISSHNSGAGKSLFLANLGVNWALAGLNVLYVTLELSENLVSMRVDSMVSGITTREIFKNIDDVEMKVKMIGKKSGAFQVKYMPSGKTPNDIRAYIKEYEIKTGRKVDVLLIDYLDLLMPNGAKISAENLFIKDKYVSEELRNLAMELNTVFVTAAQLNRCLKLDTLVESNGKKIQIKDVQVGDYLTSNQGPVRVDEVLPISKQHVYKIKTKSGKEIICSANHKFPTTNGISTLASGLKVGNKLQSLRSRDK